MNDPRLPIVWDPRFAEYDFGPGHPFSMAHRELAADLLAEAPGAEKHLWWIRAIEPAELPEGATSAATEAARLVVAWSVVVVALLGAAMVVMVVKP